MPHLLQPVLVARKGQAMFCKPGGTSQSGQQPEQLHNAKLLLHLPPWRAGGLAGRRGLSRGMTVQQETYDPVAAAQAQAQAIAAKFEQQQAAGEAVPGEDYGNKRKFEDEAGGDAGAEDQMRKRASFNGPEGGYNGVRSFWPPCVACPPLPCFLAMHAALRYAQACYPSVPMRFEDVDSSTCALCTRLSADAIAA